MWFDISYSIELNWKVIKLCRQERIDQKNAQENVKQIAVGDKVLMSVDALDNYSTTPYMGPYEIMKVNDNGTVKIQLGAGSWAKHEF